MLTFLYELFIAVLVLLTLSLFFFIAENAFADDPRYEHKTVAEQRPPEQFTAFEFAENQDEATLLSQYLWYHFHHRLGNNITLFNKEYLAIADLWLHNAEDRATGRRIQDLYREYMLTAEMDAEGYVSCHQHISHAYDPGWPFPLWTQADIGPDKTLELTNGWHFQSDFPPHWVGNYLRNWNLTAACGDEAIAAFTLDNADSLGIIEECWHVKATGPSPKLTTPDYTRIDAFNAPFLQLRWKRDGDINPAAPPYVEWKRAGDADFSDERRVFFYPQHTHLSGRFWHSHITMYRHPLWDGTITQLRLNLAPGEDDVTFEIDSFFTAYDSRHTINNPILILGSCHYFNWTRDIAFLRENINRMRIALKYQQTVMGGFEHNIIRVPWTGHCGGPGWTTTEDGGKIIHSGRGMGNNYWDLLPFGGDDFYATFQYYAATLALADIEAAVRSRPEWDIPLGALSMEPDFLRAHAAEVKRTANELFWNDENGRFYPSVTREGRTFDFGFTFVNLEAIWYGIAEPARADAVLSWLRGERIVEGDTATGEDIYHWRFGPRSTTRRNIEWYKFVWTHPEHIPWGGQVQDGGAVLGFTFYDLWARLHHVGPDDAWERLRHILAWQREVDAAGGYRAYYGETDRGTTLQGGGTAGGLGIDFEFYESSMLPAIVPLGFMGIRPLPDGLHVSPKLPEACPEMTATDLLYAGVPLDITVRNDEINVHVKDRPVLPLYIRLDAHWAADSLERENDFYIIREAGAYRFHID